MTLIINAITPRYCLQVADTRLTNTKDGFLFDDDAIKTTVVFCTNAIVTISYTGIAFIGNTRTDKWIVERLCSFKSWGKNLKEVLDYLQEVATKQFANNSSKLRLSFSIIGWYQTQTIPKPFFASITNFEDEDLRLLQEPLDHFEIRILTLKKDAENFSKTHAIAIQGVEHATTETYFDRKIRKSIKQLITNKNKSEEDIIANIVSLLRIAASHKDYGKYIGKKCVSVYIKVGEGTPVTRYHSSSGGNREYAPNLVSNGISFFGVAIESRSSKNFLELYHPAGVKIRIFTLKDQYENKNDSHY